MIPVSFSSSKLSTYVFATENMANKFILSYCGVDPPKKKVAPKAEIPPVPTSFEELGQLKVRLSESDNVIAKKVVSANFGAKNEKTVRQLYMEETSNILGKTQWFTARYPTFEISGRCDSTTTINGVDYVVEIKTRSTNKLGMTKNERLQCLSYCNGLNIEGLIFVEQDNTKRLIITTYDNFRTKFSKTWEIAIDNLTNLVKVSELARTNPELYIVDGSVVYDMMVEYICWV